MLSIASIQTTAFGNFAALNVSTLPHDRPCVPAREPAAALRLAARLGAYLIVRATGTHESF